MSEKTLREFEAFIHEGIAKAEAAGYRPNFFKRMIEERGVLETVQHLVHSTKIHDGLIRMRDLDLLDWTCEAAVIKYPSLFPADVIAHAGYRIIAVKQHKSKSKPRATA